MKFMSARDCAGYWNELVTKYIKRMFLQMKLFENLRERLYRITEGNDTGDFRPKLLHVCCPGTYVRMLILTCH